MKKHAKKRERPARRERIPRSELRRDPEFARQLAENWDMEQAPGSYRRALRQVYAELPDELPVKRDPVRHALKGLAAAAALFVAVCSGLLALNATQPQIAEALPGLGRVFRALNQPDQVPDPHPTVTTAPDPSPSPSAGREDASDRDALAAWGREIAPEFEPIEVLDQNNALGSLWIDRAWSDGVYLVLDLRLEETDNYFALQLSRAQSLVLSPENVSLVLNGEVVSIGPPNAWAQPFTRDAGGELTTQWAIPLENLMASQDGMPYSGDTLEVSLSLETMNLSFLDSQEAEDLGYTDGVRISCGYYADSFLAPCCVEYYAAWEDGTMENGATLQGVAYTPTLLGLTLEMPFLGYSLPEADFSLRAAGGIFPPMSSTSAIGVQGVVVTTESGRALTPDVAHSAVSSAGGTNYGLWCFTGMLPGEHRFTVTLYDATSEKRCYDDSGEVQAISPGEFQVTAEFTVDITTATTEVTYQFLDQGYTQLDPSSYEAPFLFSTELAGGYYLGGLLQGAEASQAVVQTGQEHCAALVTLYSQDLAYRPVELVCYSGEETMVVRSQDPTAFNSIDEGAGVYYHLEGQGEYWEGYTSLGDTGRQYRAMEFRVYAPGSWAQNSDDLPTGSFDRISLVDGETGEVLIQDLQEAWSLRNGQGPTPAPSPNVPSSEEGVASESTPGTSPAP